MRNVSLVCLGDSITWGFPYGPHCSWVEISQKALGLSMINRGINGDTAEDLLERFNSDVLDLKPSHVTIMVGTNDATMGMTLEEYSRCIQTMCLDAAKADISAIIALPVPSADRWLEYTLDKYRHWLRNYADKNKVPLLDFCPGMKMPDGSINMEFYVDEVHPNKKGYEAMAERFTDFARKFL